MLPMMKPRGGAIVTLDFDTQVAWPVYDWMGVARPGSIGGAISRAGPGSKEIRVNSVSAGPMDTVAGKGIPGFNRIAGSWADRAPLGWDTTDGRPVAGAIAFLLSDLAKGIPGELVHVDGGFHAMGTEPSPPSSAPD